jgi:hypothetical protein
VCAVWEWMEANGQRAVIAWRGVRERGAWSVESKSKKECKRRSECDASSQSINLQQQRSDPSQTEPAKGRSLTEMCGEVEEAVVQGRRRRAQAHHPSATRARLVPSPAGAVRRLGHVGRGQGAGVEHQPCV